MPEQREVVSENATTAGLVVTGVKVHNGDLPPGTPLGDWRVEQRLGAGGMGTVYSAVHRIIGKRAAVKVVRGELCTSPLTRERFVQEARVVNQIGHPNIVDIFHIGTLDDGRPYLVMELLVGRTLADRMAQGRLPAPEIIDVLLQVCGALGAAHARGVIHRDLKPDNIFLSQNALDGHGRVHVKLLDWGIAKLMDDSTLAATLTTTGMIVGTPQYVSPEQARAKHVDHRTDIYSLGTIAYELFLEGPPFVADSVADLVAMHLREPPLPPSELWPDIPAELERLLLAMLAKDAAERPSLHDVVTALLRIRHELVNRAFSARRATTTRLAAGSVPPPLNTLDRLPTLPAMSPATLPPGVPVPGHVTASGPIAVSGSASGAFDISSLVASSTHTPAPWPYGRDNTARRARRATMERYTGGVAVRSARWTYIAVGASLAALGGVAMLLLREPGPLREPVAPTVAPAESSATAATESVSSASAGPPSSAAEIPVAAPIAAPAAAPVVADVRPAASFDIRISPRNARVRIDGVEISTRAGRVHHEVPPGRHEVEIDAAGHGPYRRMVEVAGGTVLLDVTLRKASGRRDHRHDSDKARARLNPDGTIDPFQ